MEGHSHSCSDLSNDGVNFATRGDKNNNEEHIINPEKGTALATKGKATNKTKSKTIICYKCGEDGHLSPNCPNLNKKDDSSENEEHSMSGNQLLMQGIHNHLETYSFSSQGLSEDHGRVKNFAASKHNISQDWILLDNQSTVDVFINPRLVKDVRVTDTIIHIHCHSGTSSTRLQATLSGYGTVWFDPKGIANILSLSNVKDKYRVTFDSSTDDTFYVHKSDGSTRKFVVLQSGGGLNFLDTAKDQKSLQQIEFIKTGAIMVNTVEQNKTRYSGHDIKRAEHARKTQDLIGRPSTSKYLSIIANNILPNCKVTINDIKIAEDIFGTNLGSLEVKLPEGLLRMLKFINQIRSLSQ
jgi:hypothetical protein